VIVKLKFEIALRSETIGNLTPSFFPDPIFSPEYAGCIKTLVFQFLNGIARMAIVTVIGVPDGQR
jgi:hypothetical protein